MERVVLVVDIRKTTNSNLEAVKRAVQTFCHEKLVHKVTHEVGLVTFGSECDGGKCDNVSVIHPLEVVGMETLRCASDLGSSSSSAAATVSGRFPLGCLSNAMLSALDMLGASKKKVGKRKMVVISTFDDLSTHDVEHVEKVVKKVAEDAVEFNSGTAVLFKLVHFDPRRSEDHWLWRRIAAPHRAFVQLKVVHTPGQLMTCFPIKETKEAHVIYSGKMKLGDNLDVSVKIAPKTKREPFMTLGNTSGNLSGDAFERSHAQSSDGNPWSATPADWYRPEDVEHRHSVPMHDRIKAFKFGNVMVPMSQPLVELSRLSPERGIWLIGFMNRSDLSPELFMGTAKVLFGNKDDTASVSALCSLAAAMAKKHQVALLRVVLRAGSSIKLMVAYPMVRNPAYFILKEAPFMEDVLAINCKPLPEPDPDLVLRTRELVKSNFLHDNVPDLNNIGNPTLHRALNYFTERLLADGAHGSHRNQDDEEEGSSIPAEAELFIECFGDAIIDIDG